MSLVCGMQRAVHGQDTPECSTTPSISGAAHDPTAPEAVHARLSARDETFAPCAREGGDDDQQNDIELSLRRRRDLAATTPSSTQDDNIDIPTRRAQPLHELSALSRFWQSHVRLTVKHEACRDHLALERTFLSYLRTSLAFSNVGVAVHQLFLLQVGSDNASSTFYRFGKPLSTLFICIGILVCLTGAWHFYEQQAVMVTGKIVVSTWKPAIMTTASLIVMAVLFGVIVGLPA